MHIQGAVDGSQSVLVASGMTQLEFLFLEELYLEQGEPKWINLRAPRLTSLRIDDFIPSDLRHISHSTTSSIRLKFASHHSGSWEVYLPSADKLQLRLGIDDLFHLNVHPSQIQAVGININIFAGEVVCSTY